MLLRGFEAPAAGSYFEDFTCGVREIKDDLVRKKRIADEGEAVIDALLGEIRETSAGFEGAEGVTIGGGGGRGFEFFVEVGEEPIAEFGGAQRDEGARFGAGGDGGAGLAVDGAEGSGLASVIEEGAGLVDA